MPTDVVMPRLSESMEEGTILRWLVEEGGEVRAGQPLVEIETDKANSTYDAETDGTLLEVIAKEGDTLPVGELIGRIEAAAAASSPNGSRSAAGARGEVETQELTRTQQNVSRRMAESKATAPDFTLTVDVDMTLAVELRTRLEGEADPTPSHTDMVVKACASALREHPRVNGAYRDAKFELYSRVNIGIVVPAQGAPAVPTIFDADRKSLGQIAREARELAAKARDGQLTSPELAGGTFTVSDFGAFGIDEATAVIQPPQAAILTVGALKKRPAVADHGRVVAREGLRLSLVSDQRILYGPDAAEFLARVRQLLEQPLSLAL